MEINETDILARHAMEKNHRRADNTVKPKAFQPARDNSTSTFNITDLNHDEIKEIGRVYVAEPQGKSILGWSEITVQSVIEAGLIPDPDNTPPRHVNIMGWPDDPGERLSIQQILAANASFINA